MRNLYICAGFIGVTTLVAACEVQVKGGTEPHHPVRPAQPGVTPAAVTPAPAPTPHPKAVINTAFGRGRLRPAVGPHPATPAPGRFSPTPIPTAPGGQPAPGTPPIMTGTNVFGTGNADTAQTGFTGSVYWIPTTTTAMPAYQTMQPAGFLFAQTLAVTPKPMTGGFPGIDANHNEWFGIEWEAPLVVDTESDYTFRVSSDDGATVTIDGLKIVDDDGAHGLKDASGPVHLVPGQHELTIDYFQATQSVALELYCTKAGGQEQICPAHLP